MNLYDTLLRIIFAIALTWAIALLWLAPKSPWGVVASFTAMVVTGLIVLKGVRFWP